MNPIEKKYIKDVLGELNRLGEWYEKKYGPSIRVQTGPGENDRMNVLVAFTTPDEKEHISATYFTKSQFGDIGFMTRWKEKFFKKMTGEVDLRWAKFRN